MRWTQVLLIVLLAALWSSCSSTRWVHPAKQERQLTYDYNACERDIMNSMATNPGARSVYSNVSIEQERIAGCLHQKGWRQIED